MINEIFPRGDRMPDAHSGYFSGQAYLNMLVPGGSQWNCPTANVTFEPGCRNNWHRHPGGQILLVTGGRGWYQEDGMEARELSPGDVVTIPADTRHWHGAAKDSWFSHIAIETNPHKGPVQWMEPVGAAQYDSLS